jgi:IS5 family transposase
VRAVIKLQVRDRQLFEQLHVHLEAQGIKVSKGTIVDATIISAPSS